ncbi:MAG: signal peptide peptidase SppA [Sphingomonadales bacterium]|nr:signal peptide peptidase SppA [Sphingomonadales bacterium]PIX66665.1 MAG: signal peptide peptidase SppA [Sphingomonadales bacterium CG_4_10_14_3_um_filter_58_15]NCO49776.1 signal peptide peptidase SppA [Sphingomonadales bacterium]NCP00679.1 signal peptide peptidase SppA [Sphingomonadales bacterium]NCP27562.1 signal peptide peptidase SppA [Sphingomonadales bacterium]
MQFVRAAWKFLVAIKDGMVLIAMLLFFFGLYALLSSQPNSAAIRDGALLLDLNGVIVEEPAAPTFEDFLAGSGSDTPREYRLRDVVHAIDATVGDDRVKAIVLELSGFVGGGQTSLTDVGEALARAKKAGKPIYAFGSFYSDDSYQLAAHATEIWLDPMGGIVFAGPGGNRLYYKGLIDRLGVTANIYRVGTYKSAVEPYMRADQSPAAREASEALYGVLWDSWLSEVKKTRPAAVIQPFADNPATFAKAAGGDLAKVAMEQKLVNKLGDKTAFDRFVAAQVGTDETPSPDSFKSINYDDFVAANPLDTAGSPIGVITVAGEIVGGETGPGMAASGRIAEQIYKALDEDEIKALVVRIDSPGGSAFASEEIRLALLEARKKKLPIVVSMGDVAASGGYWVATAGDHIFAEPDTITGSIGVFAVLPSFEKALAKWGVTADGVQTTPLSGEPNFVGGFSDDLNVILQSGVENSYGDFVNLVATARGKTPAQVDTIGQGRVWDGGTARQLGLVDGFGGMKDALAEAAKRAGLAEGDYHAQYLDPESRLSWLPFGGIPFVRQESAPVNGVIGWAAQRQKAIFGQALATAQGLLTREDVQALCLECGAAVHRKARASADWIDRLLAYSASSAPR